MHFKELAVEPMNLKSMIQVKMLYFFVQVCKCLIPISCKKMNLMLQ